MKRRRQRRRGRESDSSDMSDVSDLSEGEITFIHEIFISFLLKNCQCPKPEYTFNIKQFKRILALHIVHSQIKLQNYSVHSKNNMLLGIDFLNDIRVQNFILLCCGKFKRQCTKHSDF